MKNFIGTFIGVFILCYFFLFFGGILIFENLWATLAFIAFVITVLITLFVHQETKIDQLEAKIKALESKIESQDTQQST